MQEGAQGARRRLTVLSDSPSERTGNCMHLHLAPTEGHTLTVYCISDQLYYDPQKTFTTRLEPNIIPGEKQKNSELNSRPRGRWRRSRATKDE